MSDRPLDGRVAIVSGADHGIGASTAAELARLGADAGSPARIFAEVEAARLVTGTLLRLR